MNTVFDQFGRTIWYAVLFIAAVTLITAGTYAGEVFLLNNATGDTLVIDTSKDAYTQEGLYADTNTSANLVTKPTITLKVMPELNKNYAIQDILEINESNGNKVNDFYVVSISDESMQSVGSNTDVNVPVYNDAIADGKVTLDKKSNTLTNIKFNKQGTYRLNLRINGTAVSRKSYVLTVR